MPECTKMRMVEVIPVDSGGERIILLRDPEKISPAIMQVSQEALFIISLLDGKHSILDIQEEFLRFFGELLYTERIESIIKQLDDNYFLENDRSRELIKRKEEEFRSSPIRPAAHSGTGYPDDPESLNNYLHSFFTQKDGPGEISAEEPSGTLRAIVAPHIDFDRGGRCYAYAYKAIAENCKARTFILFGTAHTYMKRPFALTEKDFQTPLGTVECERDICKAILKRTPWATEDEFAHRNEHSIEFQVLFLKHIFSNKEIKIVPILCGSFHEFLAAKKSPCNSTEMQEFLEILREIVSQYEDSVCLLAGADLSHVGLRFGDNLRLSDSFLSWLQETDKKMLETIEIGDADKFYEFICAEGDRRKICGLPPIYALLKTAKAHSGKLLRYEAAVDYKTHSVVTFASITFE